MENLGGLVGTVGFLVAIVGLVGVVRPLPSLKIPNRGRASLVLLLGFGLTAIGGSMLGDAPRNRPPSAAPTPTHETQYKAVKAAIAAGRWIDAAAYLTSLPDTYRDVASLRVQVRNGKSLHWYKEAMSAKANKDYVRAHELLTWAKEAGGRLPPDAGRELASLQRLVSRAEARAAAQARQAEVGSKRAELDRIRREMRDYTSGSVGIAVGEVRLRNTLGDRYTTGNWVYVLVLVSVKNFALDREHANPNNFTLSAPDGYTASHDTGTYGLNYLNATTLRQGQNTAGWIAFALPKSDRYTLHYQSFGATTTKEVVPGKAP